MLWPGWCSAPGSLHQCYHLLYLLKVHKSLENSWAIFKSGCRTAELLERHQMARNVEWQEQGDVGLQTTLQLGLGASKLHQKQVPWDLPPWIYADTDPWFPKILIWVEGQEGKAHWDITKHSTPILPSISLQALLKLEGREWQNSCWKGAGSGAWPVSDH